MDHARSTDPAVKRQLDRLSTFSPGRDTLGLERISTLLNRLGNPETDMPPAFHVAGTNGKGSVCAFLRAAFEAAGMAAHVYTSPHLVRFNERFRIAGKLIADETLAPLLEEVLDYADGIGPSFFEVTTAAAFLAFSRYPADVCIVEVGLGGRLDATNVIARPLVCGIAHLGVDHQAFLGDSALDIAGEKAGIAKPGRPVVTQKYGEDIAGRIEDVATERGAQWIARGRDWDGTAYRGELHYRDSWGKLRFPLPRLPGAHQADNALLAIAMLRHQQRLEVPHAAIRAAMGWAEWPARLQQLEPGPLTARLPKGASLWVDGGHNPLAGEAIATHFKDSAEFHLVAGLLANKDARGLLAPFAGLARSATFVPVEGHDSHEPEALAAIAAAHGIAASTAADVGSALDRLAGTVSPDRRVTVLILGSLYLAGEVLTLNGQVPE